MCPNRLVLLFVPEMNTGHRLQNTYLTVLWFLEIATYTNSSFNIFVYYNMGSKYRETVKMLFVRWPAAVSWRKTNKEQTATVRVLESADCG